MDADLILIIYDNSQTKQEKKLIKRLRQGKPAFKVKGRRYKATMFNRHGSMSLGQGSMAWGHGSITLGHGYWTIYANRVPQKAGFSHER